MLKRLLEELTDKLATDEAPETHAHRLEQATAALMIEIARADHDHDPRETEAVRRALEQSFHLDATEIADILEAATGNVDDAVSLFEFTNVLNETISREDKIRVIENLWRVAFADGELDHYEEHYIRRIADLMHVSHKDFVRTRESLRPD